MSSNRSAIAVFEPTLLAHIAKYRWMLSVPHGEFEKGSVPVAQPTWDVAEQLVRQVSHSLLVQGISVLLPTFSYCVDGTIDVNWRKIGEESVHFLVNVDDPDVTPNLDFTIDTSLPSSEDGYLSLEDCIQKVVDWYISSKLGL